MDGATYPHVTDYAGNAAVWSVWDRSRLCVLASLPGLLLNLGSVEERLEYRKTDKVVNRSIFIL